MPWKIIILTTLTSVLLIAYLVVSTSFADAKQQDLVCGELRITICDNLVNNFIQPADIEKILASEGIKIIGERMCHINTYDMAQLLNTRDVIKNTSVFTSIDGVLHINVYQRRPIIHIQVATGNFYIDESGYIFPLPGTHTSYAPMITGKIPMNIPVGFRGNIPESETFLQQVYQLALYIDKKDNRFWQSQITRLEVVNAANVRVIPREGNHVIDMGSLDNFQYKFKKLFVFYSKICEADDNAYERIDLRYSN
ncbi:MAG: cell division protein FtsQ/DivIB, partial [Prevotellaceae bacterium]|nr:cell division protein FtsQ/DivIB [Prevotellaceae bacterium]